MVGSVPNGAKLFCVNTLSLKSVPFTGFSLHLAQDFHRCFVGQLVICHDLLEVVTKRVTKLNDKTGTWVNFIGHQWVNCVQTTSVFHAYVYERLMTRSHQCRQFGDISLECQVQAAVN